MIGGQLWMNRQISQDAKNIMNQNQDSNSDSSDSDPDIGN